MAMRLQRKPKRNDFDTPQSREFAVQFKRRFGQQAYWKLIGSSIGAALRRSRKDASLAISAAQLLRTEGYNKFPMCPSPTEKSNDD